MIDRRLQRRDVHLRASRHESLAQHAAPVVVLHERELSEPIDLRQRFGQCAKRRRHIGGNGERVGERRERARRHRV